MVAKPQCIVVGGGLAGLMATIKIAEAGYPVRVFSTVPCRRSHSVCAQGGINASVNTKGEGDSPQQHFYETILGGDFLANQELPKGMCEAAPSIVFMFDRMGVQFNRTPEGHLDFRRFGGTLFHRTAFAGSTTGQQLIYALDEQVRRLEAEGLVTRFEGWEFLSLVLDEGSVCCGIVAADLHSLETRAFPADAVVMATGGIGAIYGRSTNSVNCNGSAQSACYQQGAVYANGEFIQVHPTAVPGEDKTRLISEGVRGEGGRLWVPKDGKPWYFLEEWYPKYGNLVPRDVASRAIYKVVYELKLGVNGQPIVYLDVTHIPRERLQRKLAGILEIYEKFIGDDPARVPMRVFPGVHYTMGGLWIDDTHMTNLPGCFAAGECEYQYHGANRLGANSLLSCVYGGMVAGPSAVRYAAGLAKGAEAVPSSVFDAAVRRETAYHATLKQMDGPENPHRLHDELAAMMIQHVTVVRHNTQLEMVNARLPELLDRWRKIGLSDTGGWANAELFFVRQLYNMLQLARVIAAGALARNESRGAHYKPDFPDRNDKDWLKTTKAMYTKGGPQLEYEPVNIKYFEPKLRSYV
ncbi:MAG: succinate dehydrogenase flavoprotein subunit [Deltaproteobacteria bacterium]|nr:succinate dehydrogenase flavoprotein subunit [Deltaproteobacteria bacterium]